jgi:hypothetical protein
MNVCFEDGDSVPRYERTFDAFYQDKQTAINEMHRMAEDKQLNKKLVGYYYCEHTRGCTYYSKNTPLFDDAEIEQTEDYKEQDKMNKHNRIMREWYDWEDDSLIEVALSYYESEWIIREVELL